MLSHAQQTQTYNSVHVQFKSKLTVDTLFFARIDLRTKTQFCKDGLLTLNSQQSLLVRIMVRSGPRLQKDCHLSFERHCIYKSRFVSQESPRKSIIDCGFQGATQWILRSYIRGMSCNGRLTCITLDMLPLLFDRELNEIFPTNDCVGKQI